MKTAKAERYFHFGWFPTPEVKEFSIANAPGFMQGLSVLFVSDVHLRRSVCDEALAALMRMIREQRADLILFGGDYAESADQHERFFSALAEVHAPLGIFGVMGNNDREIYAELDALRKMAAAGGMRLLVNEHIALETGGRLEIGGCDDHKWGKPRTEHLFSDGDYRILLSHFPVKPDCEADLMLSGHTHGGQFNLWGLTPYSIGFEFNYRMEALSGLHSFGKRQLLVGNGIGVSKLPLRIGARPQILLVKFTG